MHKNTQTNLNDAQKCFIFEKSILTTKILGYKILKIKYAS